MILPKIMNVGVYRHAEKHAQTITGLWICLSLKGLIRSAVYYPDGTLFRSFDASKQKFVPELRIVTPGFRTDFEYGPSRENWVLMLAFPAIRFQNETHRLFWNYNGTALEIPNSIPLKTAEAEELRQTFETLNILYSSSLPRNQLEAELTVLRIFQRFLFVAIPENDLVERFRKRLDEDSSWDLSIAQHCLEMGVNRDFLRKLFFDRYKIEPGEYRIRMRLRKILHLITYTRLNLKEIAFKVGMKNSSHLSVFIRKRCGTTPSALGREYRKTVPPLPAPSPGSR